MVVAPNPSSASGRGLLGTAVFPALRIILRMEVSKSIARVRGVASPSPKQIVINTFHSLYYRTATQNTWYHGIQVLKCPLDLWVYQEILTETPVDLIVETGTHNGGSALYLAHICDRLDRGRIISVDIKDNSDRPMHPRIEYRIDSSTSAETFQAVQEAASEGQRTMFIFDSDHTREHVLGEMLLYADLVTPGSYMIVEDGNINGHPVYVDFGPGPQEAIEEFLPQRNDFTIDKSREKFLISMNPNGYLRRNF